MGIPSPPSPEGSAKPKEGRARSGTQAWRCHDTGVVPWHAVPWSCWRCPEAQVPHCGPGAPPAPPIQIQQRRPCATVHRAVEFGSREVRDPPSQPGRPRDCVPVFCVCYPGKAVFNSGWPVKRCPLESRSRMRCRRAASSRSSLRTPALPSQYRLPISLLRSPFVTRSLSRHPCTRRPSSSSSSLSWSSLVFTSKMPHGTCSRL